MNLRCRHFLLAALLGTAGLSAHADTFNLGQLTDVAVPSTRGNANTTYFGWELFNDSESPAYDGVLLDSTPDVGTDPGGVQIRTVNNEDHINASGNLQVSTSGHTLYEEVTVKTDGTVGATGTTTIIAQFVTSSGDFPSGAITLSSINGVLPNVVRSVNAEGKGQVWAKWVLSGNAATYAFTILGPVPGTGYSVDRLVVDTHWSATTPQPDTAIAKTLFTMDQSTTVATPSFRGAPNSTWFGWDTWNDIDGNRVLSIDDSTPDINAVGAPNGVKFKTLNAPEVHMASGSGNFYIGSGSVSEEVTVVTAGTVGSSGTTTIIAQIAAGGIVNFPSPLSFSSINGVEPTVVSAYLSNKRPGVWVKWVVPGNQASYTFTITGAAVNNPSTPYSFDRVVVDTLYSSAAAQDDMQATTPVQTFAMDRMSGLAVPSTRGGINTTWFGWETFDAGSPLNDSTPDIGTTTTGPVLTTTNAQNHGYGSFLYTGGGQLAEQVTVPTSGTVGTSGVTTIIAQFITTSGNLPGSVILSPINGVSPTIVQGRSGSGGKGQVWAKWEIPGNQASYTFTISGEGASQHYAFDRIVVDTLWKSTAQGDVMLATAPSVVHVMNQISGIVTPSTRGGANTTWFGWETFNNIGGRSVPINDSTPDIGTTTLSGANFQTTTSGVHVLSSGNLYTANDSLTEQLTIPTNGTVGSNGFTTIIVQIESAVGFGAFSDTITFGSIGGVDPTVVQALNTKNGGTGQIWAKWVVPGNQASYTIPVTGPVGVGHFSFDRVLVDTAWSLSSSAGDSMSDAHIVVEQPADTSLVDGAATVDLGSAALGGNVSKIFTIKNTGTTPLTGITATIDGANASEFSITTAPATSVNGPTGSTTLTVKFTPTSAGIKNAVLHIASNEGGTLTPFDVNLTAATPPSFVLGAAGFTVMENVGSGQVNIPVQRLGYTGTAVSVKLVTTAGTAKTPQHYGFTSPVTASYTVNFPVGEDEVLVPIDIVNTVASEVNRTFTVKLQTPVGGTLGTLATAPVTIIDTSAATDSTAPVAPVISTPVANTLVAVDAAGKVTITGTATDSQGVQSVQARFVTTPASSFTAATLGTPGAPSTTYSITLTPPPGATSTVEVTATNYASPTPLTSIASTRTFRVAVPLVVSISGTGTVTTGYSPSSPREQGKSYTITATPSTVLATSSIFTGWTLGGTDVGTTGAPAFSNSDPASLARLGIPAIALQKQSLTFTFRQGLTLTANFVANPYASTVNVVSGTYNGLIKASPTLPDRAGTTNDFTPPANATEGHFNATVQNTGAFSGKLTIDGLVLNVAGNFDADGHARFGTAKLDTLVVARTGKPGLSVKLDIGLPTNSIPVGKITGQISATEFLKSTVAAVSTISADRAYFTGLTAALTVPDNYLTVTGTALSPVGRTDGSFTVVMPAVDLGSQPTRIAAAGFTTMDYPQGDGIGIVKVTKAGLVTLSGSLADGTVITASGTLSQGLEVALFAQLYNKLGFYSALVKLDFNEADSDMKSVSGTEVLWGRPFIGTSQYYPYGWPEVIKSDFLGAKYLVTANQSSLRAPDDGDGDSDGEFILDANASGNATLTLEDGQLTESLEKVLSVTLTDTVAKVPDNDPTFSLSITRTTGALSGSFTHTDDTVPLLKGTIFQKGANAGGYGYFLTKQPTTIDYTGESGGFSLIAQPQP